MLPLFILAALLLILAISIWLVRPNNAINRWFATLTASMACWAVGLGGLQSGTFLEAWGRVTFASASFVPATFFAFVREYPTPSQRPSLRIVRAMLLIAAAFAALSLSTPLIVYDVSLTAAGLTRKPGLLYVPFAVFFLAGWTTALSLLVVRWRRAGGLARVQLQYLGMGLIISTAGGVTTNLAIPLFTGQSTYAWVGPYFALPLITLVAHAIIRYRLMDIKVVIQKGTVYVCAVAIAAFIFIGLAGVLSSVEAYALGSIPLGVAVALAVIVAIFFQPLKWWIQASMNRYFYRETYDYQRTVREASQRLNTILDLQSLLDYIAEVIEKTLKVEMVAVFMRDHPEQVFTPRVLRRAAGWEQGSLGPVVSGTSPLVAFFEREKHPLVSDDAARDSGNFRLASAVEELRVVGGDIAFPFIQDHTVSGILVIGPKLSGDPYFAEDIDLLSTLSSQAGISVKNAQLYREVTLANEYIENILATMESGVIAVNGDRRITLCNRVAERMTGRSAGDLRLVPLAHLPAPLANPLDAALGDGQPRLQLEIILPDASGRLIPMACSTSALRDVEGNILGAVAVFSDLSRLKELEGEKRRAERLAAFGALASGIAHEIKNPLVAIKTFAELIPERYADADFRENFSKVAIKEITRIDDLVARLRGLSGPTEHVLHQMDIRGPIEETLTLLGGQLEQKRITVRRLYAEPLPLVGAHEPSLKQLFLNLFMNSLDAMEEGGELAIKLTRRWRYGAPTLLVEVSDTGSGVLETMLDRIFAPFVTTKARGSGLGLAICRGIADAHRATIHAENNPERPGLTMAVEFPALEGTLAVA